MWIVVYSDLWSRLQSNALQLGALAVITRWGIEITAFDHTNNNRNNDNLCYNFKTTKYLRNQNTKNHKYICRAN